MSVLILTLSLKESSGKNFYFLACVISIGFPSTSNHSHSYEQPKHFFPGRFNQNLLNFVFSHLYYFKVKFNIKHCYFALPSRCLKHYVILLYHRDVYNTVILLYHRDVYNTVESRDNGIVANSLTISLSLKIRHCTCMPDVVNGKLKFMTPWKWAKMIRKESGSTSHSPCQRISRLMSGLTTG